MILVDTQTVIWLAGETDRISRAAAEAIRQARTSGGVAISDKTLWEVAMAYSYGRIQLGVSLRDLLETTEKSFVVLPISAAVAERSVQFGRQFPADPADRIIAATAIVYGLKLVSSDAEIRRSGEVPTIW